MLSGSQLQFNNNQFQAILDGLSTQVAILDQTGKIVATNQAWKSNLGVGLLVRNASVGENYLKLSQSINNIDQVQLVVEAIEEIINNQREEFKLEYSRDRHNQKNWFIINLKKLPDGDFNKILISQENITEYKQMESSLRSVAEGTAYTTGQDFFYSLVYHLTRALSVDYAFVTECLEQSNPPRVSTLAFWCKQYFGHNFEYSLANTPCQKVINGLPCLYPSNLQQIFPFDLDLVKYRAESYVGVPLINSSGKILGHLAVISEHPIEDGSLKLSILEIFAARATAELERKRAEEQLIYDALHDGLTGLPNRNLFSEHLNRVLKKHQRNPENQFAVLFLDLDRFKVVNDSLGHTIGDQLLIQMGKRIQACLRSSDLLARLGGDEFAILLEGINTIKDATKFAKRIQKSLTLPFWVGSNEVFTSASIGIAFSDLNSNSSEELLRNADIAMYKAKALGKSRHELFNETLHIEVVNRLQLETDFRRALDKGELQLHYQPIISLSNQKVIGFEALVRWHHPKRGYVCPEKFISLAEETGMVIPLGWWVLQEACYQLREWQINFNNPNLTVGVNFSQKQLSQTNLVDSLLQILEATGLEAKSLKLEITESMLMDDIKATMKTLSRLKAVGIQLHLDDFGTGYSSLSYLHSLPIDALKIDRSFIKNIDQEGKNSKIVEAIVMMAKSLELKVIAEGIETPIQLAKLQKLQCPYGQGYLFSRPLSPQVLQSYLNR
ncbi:response regulator receiver modulated diguanylate cyclase/phosphodiesterase with PAS/PAC sensor [Stanieria sp. NIES-3757]|nr:response regulator receiver modulated diguanylate cyclase/phosphodiesterase with PAS/PAC sensor [Stanieria sp. NIES-3757]